MPDLSRIQMHPHLLMMWMMSLEFDAGRTVTKRVSRWRNCCLLLPSVTCESRTPIDSLLAIQCHVYYHHPCCSFRCCSGAVQITLPSTSLQLVLTAAPLVAVSCYTARSIIMDRRRNSQCIRQLLACVWGDDVLPLSVRSTIAPRGPTANLPSASSRKC